MSFTFTIRTDSDTVTIDDTAGAIVATFPLGFELGEEDNAQQINDRLLEAGWDTTGEQWASDDLTDGAGDAYTLLAGTVVPVGLTVGPGASSSQT